MDLERGHRGRVRRDRLYVALAAFLSLILAATASAQAAPPPSDGARAEARERFARALRLFNENDNAAALAEYLRVYDLLPTTVVLYNIALVYAAMGRPVEAVDALDRLLKDPTSLTPDQLARANATRAAETERVGLLAVTCNVEGASVEVDNLDVAHTPVSSPLKVATGSHVVAAVAPGYVPIRKAVTVAGHATADVSFDLQPMQGRLAHVTVHSDLPAAEVLVDGQAAGQTPLPSSISLAPGRHRVEIRRLGYVTAGQDVMLGDGATGDVVLDPEEDPVLAPLDGTLALTLRETAVVVTVDGKLRGAYSGPLHLPEGRHRLRVERAGFFVSERDVVIAANRATDVVVDLEPSPDTLAQFTTTVRTRRTWGIGALIGGAAVTAAGAIIVFVDAGERGSDRRAYDSATNALASYSGNCAFSSGARPAQCYGPINTAADSYNATLARDALGYTLVGVGVVALAAGGVLLFNGDDPHRYDKKPSAVTIAGVGVTPVAGGAPGSGYLGLSGSF